MTAQPWMDTSLGADERASLLLRAMRLDEKLGMVSGFWGLPYEKGEAPPEKIFTRPLRETAQPPPGSRIACDGYVPACARLGIPSLQLCGGGQGITHIVFSELAELMERRASTCYPSPIAQTASWNPELVHGFGACLGREARCTGVNVILGGAMNLALEPRCGRTFEYHGEDPILAGLITSAEIRGVQSQNIIGTIKHFAGNFQETGRFFVNTRMDERAFRQTELLAFEIAITRSKAGAVMTAYNLVNGIYASESHYLLQDVLKDEWGFKGWVMTDWGAAHATAPSALAGLDQELPNNLWFGEKLRAVIDKGDVPEARLDDMVRRILRSMFACGVMDDPPVAGKIDFAPGAETALRLAQESIVLLQNNGILPLDETTTASIALVGSHADVGVLSGSGSGAVFPHGGLAVPIEFAGSKELPTPVLWLPSSPMEALKACLPNARLSYTDGADIAKAAALAQKSDIAIVFANQPATEHQDHPDLNLPGDQNALIHAVAKANAKTIVVLETGGPVRAPWKEDVAAILEAWYPGEAGGVAMAQCLTGRVNPSGKLPVSFPAEDADLPYPVFHPPKDASSALDGAALVNLDEAPPTPFDALYDKGVAFGYKWFDATGKTPLFPFGHGLSYTQFAYADLEIVATDPLRVRFKLTNTGSREGAEVAQIYLALPPAAEEPPRRLVGWKKISLKAGESALVEERIDALFMSVWDTRAKTWQVLSGDYEVFVGASSRDLRLRAPFERA